MILEMGYDGESLNRGNLVGFPISKPWLNSILCLVLSIHYLLLMVRLKIKLKTHLYFLKNDLESRQLNLQWKLSGSKGYIYKPKHNIKNSNGESSSELWGTYTTEKQG